MSHKRYHSNWLTGLELLFLLAHFFPAVTIPGGGSGWASTGEMRCAGYECLVFLPYVLFFPPWWANPLFVAGVVSHVYGRRWLAFGCGVAASVLALSTVLLVFRLLRNWMFEVRLDPPPQFPLGPGYFLWLTCMLGLACVACFTSPGERGDVSPPSG